MDSYSMEEKNEDIRQDRSSAISEKDEELQEPASKAGCSGATEKSEAMLQERSLATFNKEDEEFPRPVAKRDYAGAAEKTDPKEIALVKKLDRWIMPMLWSMYWLHYLDRNATALARLNTFEEDLRLTGNQYQTCVSILFVGYLLGQIPSNMFLTRTRPSRYLACAMMLTAVISALTAVCSNYVGLIMARFVLGVCEAPYDPGAVYLLSIFYTRKEVATRLAILYTGNILSQAFAGLIAAGIFHGLDNVAGIAGWRWLFILQGAVTLVVAVFGFFILPDFPLTTVWLTPAERQLAHSRVELDTVGNEGETDIWAGFRQAASDPMTWVFAIMAHSHLAANGFKKFLPTVVETLGLKETITLVLTSPPYLIAGAISIAVSWSSGHFDEVTWHTTFTKAVAAVGFVIACVIPSDNVAGRYTSMVIFAIGTYAGNSIIMGWTSSTCSQTKEKKAVAIGIVSTVSEASFVWTPFLWPESDSPGYRIALGSSAGFSVVTIVTAWIARILLKRRNAKLKRNEDETNGKFYIY